jgi:prolyl-tRNA editing enzyme YbaK/EbsC (Cys-tRNA(Pro) deacylase)
VPPFGEPVLDLPLFVDPSILQNDRVAFNAGSLTDSIVMARADYIGVAKPAVLDFGER